MAGPQMQRLALIALAFGFGLAVLGVILVALGEKGESKIEVLGFSVQTGSVGIGAICFGAIVIVVSFTKYLQFVAGDRRREKERQQHKERFRLGVKDLLRTLDEAKTKANEDAQKLKKQQRDALSNRIDNRINSVKERVQELEQQAESAIDNGDGTLVQDITKSITTCISQSGSELAEEVNREVSAAGGGWFSDWWDSRLAAGIAVGLGAIAAGIAAALRSSGEESAPAKDAAERKEPPDSPAPGTPT
jgi:hypothetical protein